MPITTQVFAVTNTPQQIAAGNADGVEVVLVSDAAGVVVGGPTVTPTTGVTLAANSPLTLNLRVSDVLYAVTATAGNVAVLRTRQ